MNNKSATGMWALAIAVAVWAGRAVADDAPTTLPSTAPAVVQWSDAAKHVGETVTVTGPVVSTHASKDGKTVSLNVGKDFPSTDRFTVFLTTDTPDKADDKFNGKTVTVTGKVEMYKKAPEIKATEKDVTVN